MAKEDGQREEQEVYYHPVRDDIFASDQIEMPSTSRVKNELYESFRSGKNEFHLRDQLKEEASSQENISFPIRDVLKIEGSVTFNESLLEVDRKVDTFYARGSVKEEHTRYGDNCGSSLVERPKSETVIRMLKDEIHGFVEPAPDPDVKPFAPAETVQEIVELSDSESEDDPSDMILISSTRPKVKIQQGYENGLEQKFQPINSSMFSPSTTPFENPVSLAARVSNMYHPNIVKAASGSNYFPSYSQFPSDMSNYKLAPQLNPRLPTSSPFDPSLVNGFKSSNQMIAQADMIKLMEEMMKIYDKGSGSAHHQHRRLPESLSTKAVPQPSPHDPLSKPGVPNGNRNQSQNPLDAQSARMLNEIIQGLQMGQLTDEADLKPGTLSVSLLKHQRLALAWMEKRENSYPAGGILADDQGLGKTITTLALILKSYSQSNRKAPHLENLSQSSQKKSKMVTLDLDPVGSNIPPLEECPAAKTSKRMPGGTLVVCPTSVLRQWASEIRSKVGPELNFRVYVHHGPGRTRNAADLAKYDVVLTTYSIVSMEVPRQEKEEERDPEKYGLGPSKEKKAGRDKAKAKGKGVTGRKRQRAGEGEEDGDMVTPSGGTLDRVSWLRVVLDEAQCIKNRRTLAAQACWSLRAKKRWCLSGTPIQNSVDDVYSYFRFLRWQPFDEYGTFRIQIKDVVEKNPKLGYPKLQHILKAILLRRTKATKIDGKPIVNLPPRIITHLVSEFSPEERGFYNWLETSSKEKFQGFEMSGTLERNYASILVLLLQLRQACGHPALVKLKGQVQGEGEVVGGSRIEKRGEIIGRNSGNLMRAKSVKLEESASRMLESLEGYNGLCQLCNDPPDDPVVTPCLHVFCDQCISVHLSVNDSCPDMRCTRQLTFPSDVFSHDRLLCSMEMDILGGPLQPKPDPGARNTESAVTGSRNLLLSPITPAEPSAKVKALLTKLLSLPKTILKVKNGKIFSQKTALFDPEQAEDLKVNVQEAPDPEGVSQVVATEKTIVFSQWTSMLNFVEAPLTSAGITFRRLDGTMSVQDRDDAVIDFCTRPEVTVILMSLKAASLGLNLVSACHVILLDVWWNPATEEQAIDRAHRIGQTRPVNVSRFTIKDTIEDRILQLQEKKRDMVSSAFGEGGQSGGNRLSTADLRFLFQV